MTQVVVTRTVDWVDTDAAGHYHHSAVIRWVEAAENALHEELGLLDLFGTAPRVRYEVDYLDRLWFREQVGTTLWVEKVGTSSLAYAFEVVGPRGAAARGRMICVNVGAVDSAGSAGGACPWPPEVRERLESHADG
ncbi:acyl-CoA thioesterase [Ornithinimicrobium pratense]|uniref:Acyl-CoA thioesterase n=1 Tax=Ornithinimicrobium pratense TaxID=2593973 RepID=A0A5J6V9N9_9MICO|nr:thioesterase family protein [Ornithinimicrobium pratense]QFG69911.1 acyl-CoA thioesterase [Ornithinimicrobium pratense]